MEHGRTSSTYSNESSRKPTYLDYRSNGDTGSKSTSYQAARDYAESLGSQAPARPSPSAPVSTTSRSSSRPSSRPSFMNYQGGGAEGKTQPVAVPQPVSPAAPAAAPRVPGVVLLYMATGVHNKTMQYLQIALKRRAYASIAIIGSKEHEPAIKQLKMEIYGLIGKLGREMGVQTHTRLGNGEQELDAIVQEAVRGGSVLQGVLCSLGYAEDETAGTDILSVDRADFERSWQTSVGTLHGIAKAAIPLLTSGNNDLDHPKFFLVVETAQHTPASIVTKAACDTLLRQLSTAYTSRDLLINHAEKVLVEEPEPVRRKSVPALHTDGFSAGPTESVFTPGDSPTKLWNMWALQDEIES
ncbi:hypothetical protein LTR85_005517 [Meristemomyces frigidus]|nr:hypothetical protein LTR85_005517 [Meristemomyces frigidus]